MLFQVWFRKTEQEGLSACACVYLDFMFNVILGLCACSVLQSECRFWDGAWLQIQTGHGGSLNCHHGSGCSVSSSYTAH